ncbi:YunC family protein [Ihubacter sp. rT4E-8]|uniref:YunC family protein n=1 Tax=Ihubacter sp. rT4E-8 TaxID=3242369 RepID=UPI003CEF190E
MIQIEMLNVNERPVQGLRIVAPGGEGHPNMLVLLCKKGYIMCGYLNTNTAEVVNDAAAVIGGSTFEEILANPVKSVTPEAAALGVEVGMTGAEAADKLNG